MRKTTEGTGFARRLVAEMQRRGHVGRGRAGVDVHALAAACDVSYEMARRYVEGLAVPRPEKLAAIAHWLDVEAASLLWGTESSQPAAVNMELLEKCLAATLEAQRIAGRTLAPSALASIAVTLYDDSRRGETLSVDMLARLLRAS